MQERGGLARWKPCSIHLPHRWRQQGVGDAERPHEHRPSHGSPFFLTFSCRLGTHSQPRAKCLQSPCAPLPPPPPPPSTGLAARAAAASPARACGPLWPAAPSLSVPVSSGEGEGSGQCWRKWRPALPAPDPLPQRLASSVHLPAAIRAGRALPSPPPPPPAAMHALRRAPPPAPRCRSRCQWRGRVQGD